MPAMNISKMSSMLVERVKINTGRFRRSFLHDVDINPQREAHRGLDT